MALLDEAELEKLSAALVDLRDLGDRMLVPFEVADLPCARVAWLNDRWFTQRGLPTQCDAALRSRIEAWVLKQFAVSTTSPRDVGRCRTRVAFADRYGSVSGNSPHGGSGRVATIGQFQVKGVGPTPLVGSATWSHSHGHVSLVEALCEVILGEVLDRELPFGAVPAIAVIDAGEDLQDRRAQDPPIRRALIVRPAVLRPAHLLRAPLFVCNAGGTAAPPGTDAARTRDSIAYLASLDEVHRVRLNLPRSIGEYFERLAIQAANGDALRLFTGGLFAGNVSMDGAVMDFGAARAMYSWAKIQLHAHVGGFGCDIDRLPRIADAIHFYAAKAKCASSGFFGQGIDADALRDTYRTALRRVFGKMWSDDLVDPAAQTMIRDAMQRYFDAQQRVRLRDRWDGVPPEVDWVHARLIDDCDPRMSHDMETDLVASIRTIFRASRSRVARAADLGWRSAFRVLEPRPELDRRRLERRVARFIAETPPDAIARCSVEFIEQTLGECLRWWPACPSEFAIISQRVRKGCAALRVIDGESGKSRWWLEGLVSGDRLLWGEETLDAPESQKLGLRRQNLKWQCVLDDDEMRDALREAVSATPHREYRAPPSWWT